MMDKKLKASKCPVLPVTGRVIRLAVLCLGVFFTITGALLYFTFPLILQAKFQAEMALYEGSEATGRFETPPLPTMFSFHLFNVTNPNEVNVDGDKPKLQDVGPFVYKLFKCRVINERDDVKGTITYQEHLSFFFQPHLSVATNLSEVDIYHVNVFEVIRANQMAPLRFNTFLSIPGIMMSMGHDFGPYIVRHNAEELLFTGYRLPLLDLYDNTLGRFFKLQSSPPNNTFGYMYGRNNSLSKPITIMSGVTGVEHLAEIVEYNKLKALTFWAPNSSCNVLSGTDGTMFPPGIDKTKRLHAFMPDVCRTMALQYRNEELINNINTYRYTPPDDDHLKSEENRCFCMIPDKGNCWQGVLRIATCLNNWPLAFSGPHFMLADPYLEDHFEGLRPDPAVHSSFLNVEPTSGIVIRGERKIQVNLEILVLDGFKFLKNDRRTLFPLMWMQERGEIDEEWSIEFNNRLSKPVKYAVIVIYTMTFLGCLIVVVCAVLIVLEKRRQPSPSQCAVPSDTLQVVPSLETRLATNGNVYVATGF